MMRQCVLIYNFSVSEAKEWELAIKQIPNTQLRIVDKTEQAMLIRDLLNGKKANETAGPVNAAGFDGKMILLENINDNTLEYILAASRMITKDKVYKAVITQTNVTWNSDKLYHHLLEEDADMRRLNAQG